MAPDGVVALHLDQGVPQQVRDTRHEDVGRINNRRSEYERNRCTPGAGMSCVLLSASQSRLMCVTLYVSLGRALPLWL